MDDDADKLEWIEGYLLMFSRSGAGLLISFSDMDGPCWMPASQVRVALDDDGCCGPGIFGVPEWLVETRITVVAAEEAARQAAADRAEAEERRRARAEAERARRQRPRRPRPRQQLGFDL